MDLHETSVQICESSAALSSSVLCSLGPNGISSVEGIITALSIVICVTIAGLFAGLLVLTAQRIASR